MVKMKVKRSRKSHKVAEYKYSHMSLEEEVIVNPMMARIILETYDSMKPWQKFLMESVAMAKKMLRFGPR